MWNINPVKLWLPGGRWVPGFSSPGGLQASLLTLLLVLVQADNIPVSLKHQRERGDNWLFIH